MRTWLFLAGVNGALAVIAGAFGAHALAGRLEPRLLAAFSTGAHYHLIHAVALGVAALAMRGAAAPRARIAAFLFLVGMLLFSGSLYGLALTSIRGAFGPVTPLGGLVLIAGWIMLAAAALKMDRA